MAPRPFLTGPQQQQSPNNSTNGQNYFSRHHTNNKLPGTVELASRLEEARTSAKLLEQVVMNTPPAETLDNDLIKEFADRCLSASRSIQGYMVATNPGPDNETMESLIDTNEQLQTALNQHQRSVLSARKQLGLNVRSEDTTPAPGTPTGEPVSPILDSPALPIRSAKGKQTELYQPESSGSGRGIGRASGSGSGSGSSSNKGKHGENNAAHDNEDPFADPFADPHHDDHTPNGAARSRTPVGQDEMPHEPFHPGFTAAAVPPTGHPALADGGAAAAKDTSIEDLYDAAAASGKGKSAV